MVEMMRVLIWEEPGKVSLQQREIPKPKEGEVLVEILYNGVCSTDYPIVQGKVAGSWQGMILGHEPVARVLAVGYGVTRLHGGERVTLDTMLSCKRCLFCRKGHPEWCIDSKEIGFTVDGCYSDYAVFPAENMHILPDAVDDLSGTTLEALTCQLGGVDSLQIQYGDSVAILGTGLAALIFLQLVRLKGAGLVAISMRNYPERVRMAKEWGADVIHTGGNPQSLLDVADAAKTDGYDVVIDAVGTQETTQQAIALARRGGKVLLYGLAQEVIDRFPLGQVIFRNLTLLGRTSAPFHWEAAIELVQKGSIRVREMIEEVVNLQELPQLLMKKESGPRPLKHVVRIRGV